jgi:hypothetical protein
MSQCHHVRQDHFTKTPLCLGSSKTPSRTGLIVRSPIVNQETKGNNAEQSRTKRNVPRLFCVLLDPAELDDSGRFSHHSSPIHGLAMSRLDPSDPSKLAIAENVVSSSSCRVSTLMPVLTESLMLVLALMWRMLYLMRPWFQDGGSLFCLLSGCASLPESVWPGL